MVTIAIELNHVIRDINKQLLKYYQRDYHPELDTDDIDVKNENVLDKYIKFDSKRERNQFIYIDYPFEIFGAAKAMDKNLARDITHWMEEMSNIEEEDFRVMYYSLDEDALSIQSSYFFLSKLGTRVRSVMFPKRIDELKGVCDVIITSNPNAISWAKDNGLQTVKIASNGEKSDDKSTFNYGNMEEVINDDTFLDKVLKNIKHG